GGIASDPTPNSRGPTSYSRSPRTWSGARLVTSSRSGAIDIRRSATKGAAGNTCSKLSSSNNVGGPPHPPPHQINCGKVRQSESLGDRRRDERHISNRGQRHKHDAGCALLADHAREFKPEARLADPSWSDKRNETSGWISKPPQQRLHVRFAAEKGRQRKWQRNPAQFVGRGSGCRCPRT